jgi:hypothetical protein
LARRFDLRRCNLEPRFDCRRNWVALFAVRQSCEAANKAANNYRAPNIRAVAQPVAEQSAD